MRSIIWLAFRCQRQLTSKKVEWLRIVEVVYRYDAKTQNLSYLALEFSQEIASRKKGS